MKIYISVDMEGITGVTHWDEVDHNKQAYSQFQEQMSLEAAAACEGAFKGGAKKIIIKDAHYSGRNILAHYLPKGVKLIRGWSGHPYSMVQELDSSYDGLMMVGYHSRAGQGSSPLAHTMTGKVESIFINDQQTSEFFLHGNIAAKHSVPVIFVSGDKGLCEEVKTLSPQTVTHATMTGIGDSTISLQPKESITAIQKKSEESLKGDFTKCLWSHPDSFNVRIKFMKQHLAYRASHYNGALLLDPKTVEFITEDYDEVMRFVHFVV